MRGGGGVRALSVLSQKPTWLSWLSYGSSRLKTTRWSAVASSAAK